MKFVVTGYEHDWTNWFANEGALLFPIASAMGIDAESLMNITGWRWIYNVRADVFGTSDIDFIDADTSTFTNTFWNGRDYEGEVITTSDQRVYGFDGDDIINGNSGADTLIGGRGNDVLTHVEPR